MKLTKRFSKISGHLIIIFCACVGFCSGILMGRLIVACRAKSNIQTDTIARFSKIENVIREAGYRWVAIKEFDNSIVIIGTNTKGNAK